MATTPDFKIDFSEVLDLKKLLDGLPEKIRRQAMQRALYRVRQMAKTQIIRRSSAKVNVQQKYIRDVVDARMVTGAESGLEFVVRSGWVRLIDMNPVLAEKALLIRFLKGPATFKRGFIARLKGREAVLMRAENGSGGLVGRYPIRELHAANIAHAITRDEEYFMKVLTDIITERLEPRLMHEVENLLRRT